MYGSELDIALFHNHYHYLALRNNENNFIFIISQGYLQFYISPLNFNNLLTLIKKR